MMGKHKFTKILLISTTALTLSAVVSPTILTAHAQNNEEQTTNDNKIYLSDYDISQKDLVLLEKIASIGDFFYLDENNNAQVSLSTEDLISYHNFSRLEAEKLLTLLAEQSSISSEPIDDVIITPYAHVSNGRLYISNFDLKSGAFAAVATAATAGPAALKAAFIAASSVIGGPVGTVISSIMALVGGPGLIDIAGHITTALATGEGVYIGVQTRYPFVDTGYWKG